jgi:hypothetical protein
MHLIIILLIFINLLRNILYNIITNYLENIINTNKQELLKCEIENIAFLSYF